MDADLLSFRLRAALAGPAGPNGPPDRVTWVEAGDEVLLHLDALEVELADGSVVVRLDLEAEQIGRESLRAVFALGEGDDARGLFGVTGDTLGETPLARRWGRILTDELWQGIVTCFAEGAPEAGQTPQAAGVREGRLVSYWAPSQRQGR